MTYAIRRSPAIAATLEEHEVMRVFDEWHWLQRFRSDDSHEQKAARFYKDLRERFATKEKTGQ